MESARRGARARPRHWRGRAIVPLALASAGAGAWVVAAAAERGAPAGEDAEPTGERTAGDIARAAAQSPDALADALARPHHLASADLGPHAIRERTELLVPAGRGAEAGPRELVATAELAIESDSELRARVANEGGYAREIVATAGELYTRPGYGPYHRRPPEFPGEAIERTSELAAVSAYAAALARGAEIAEVREIERAGRAALAIELAPSDRAQEAEIPALEAARAKDRTNARAAARASEGFVEIDRETGALLRARLRGTLAEGPEGAGPPARVSLSREFERGEAASAALERVRAPAPENTVAPLDAAPDGESGSAASDDRAHPAGAAEVE